MAATDVIELMDKLGIGRFSAIGMSTGAMVLLHLATRSPERIASMVLISATSNFPEQARVIMRRASFDTLPEEVREMYRECATRGDEQIQQLLMQFSAFADNTDDMNFTAESLSHISVRTLLIHGDRDSFFPLAIAEHICHSMPNAELWAIPGGEHVPIYNNACLFISATLRFLGGEELY
jgi:pimeloyl-ACP methyl ester carboxylesterase